MQMLAIVAVLIASFAMVFAVLDDRRGARLIPVRVKRDRR